ncbi:MAG: hypothetical protein NVSMB25_05010 [Thermoleophilaceae bacterium]
MSDAAVSLSFFDGARRRSGTARAGLTLLFEGAAPTTLPSGPQIDPLGEGWHAQLEDRLSLDFVPVAPAAVLGGSSTRLCAVRGTVDGTSIDCLGTASETLAPPAWGELDALRSISAIFDRDHALFALVSRRRGALGHGEETVEAKLVAGGEIVAVQNGRLSTVYDGEGRQRSAGLELWLAGEDFPRRASGSVEAGASLVLEGLRVNAAVFRWRMDGRDGMGGYELAYRDDGEAA